MRSKVLLVAGEPASEALALSVQEVLTELAVAFGHAFLIKEEKIGDASQAAFGASLTQEVVEQAADCQATLCLSRDAHDHVALASGRNAVMGCVSLHVPDALADCSLLKTGKLASGRLMFPMRTDNQSMLQAGKRAHSLAQETGDPLSEIPFTGALAKVWHATNLALAQGGLSALKQTNLPAALHALIRTPEQFSHVYGSPTACEALEAAVVGLSGLPRACYYSVYWAERPVLYSCVIEEQTPDGISPFGALLACVDMLRRTLGLSREADCLYSSVINVLEAGWRTPDMPPKQMPRIGTGAVCQLICEQIALAGRFIPK